jgi:hypothetical protein
MARAGCAKASQELGNVSVEFKIPEDGTAATQTRIRGRSHANSSGNDPRALPFPLPPLHLQFPNPILLL